MSYNKAQQDSTAMYMRPACSPGATSTPPQAQATAHSHLIAVEKQETLMTITGEMLIGASAVRGTTKILHATNPATGEVLAPEFHGGGAAEAERACALAEAAFDTYRNTSPETRAKFLESIASGLEALGDALIERAHAE